MSIFYIADLHLSENDESKKMDVFGGRWRDYTNKIKNGWRDTVQEDDTVILGGDLSWGMTLDEALPDFRLINSLPGKKIILEGNHDFYWQSVTKMNRFCAENNLKFEFLRNNAFLCENICVCGTRGWYTDEREIVQSNADSTKIVLRETARLKASLEAGAKLGGEPVVFMHFPPVFGAYVCEEFVSVMLEFGVKKCFFGHIHGKYDQGPKTNYRGIDFCYGSADYLSFKPLLV